MYVQTARAQLHYVVSDVKLYQYQDVAMADIVSKQGASRLALITCDGTWVQGRRTYDQPPVVTPQFGLKHVLDVA